MLPYQGLCTDKLTSVVPANQGHNVICMNAVHHDDIHWQLIRAHSGHHVSPLAADQNLSAALRQAPGQTVGVADGDPAMSPVPPDRHSRIRQRPPGAESER